MSNSNIIVLDDAEAVPVRALADRLRMHPVDVVKDLRCRGYTLGSIRGAAGQWTMALRRNDAERYLAERREAAGAKVSAMTDFSTPRSFGKGQGQ